MKYYALFEIKDLDTLHGIYVPDENETYHFLEIKILSQMNTCGYIPFSVSIGDYRQDTSGSVLPIFDDYIPQIGEFQIAITEHFENADDVDVLFPDMYYQVEIRGK